MGKQTQRNYFEAAAINIIVSVMSVKFFGLVGVAVGTLVAMTYQTIWMAWYCSSKLLKRGYNLFVKQIIIDIITFTIGYLMTRWIPFNTHTFFAWVILALEVFIIWTLISTIVNVIVYKQYVSILLGKIKAKVLKK